MVSYLANLFCHNLSMTCLVLPPTHKDKKGAICRDMPLDPLVAATQLWKLLIDLQHAAMTAGHCESIYQSILDRAVSSASTLCDIILVFKRQPAGNRRLSNAITVTLWQTVVVLGEACDDLYYLIAADKDGTIIGFVNAQSMKGD